MTPHKKNVTRDWSETNSRYKKRYSEDGKKLRGCRGLLGRVITFKAISCIDLSSEFSKTKTFSRTF